MAQQTTVETATFAAGCFWGVEAEFRAIPGVLRTTVGYTGGAKDNPSYRAVSFGRTGHAEAVQVTYDPAQVSYEELLDAFWKLHNPTQRNRQGLDWGTQYRSAIFTHDDAQAKAAEAAKERAQAGFRRPIVTQIEPAATFWPAEDYHQRYLEKRGMASCAITVQS